MNFNTVKKELFSGLNTEGFVRYRNTYYKLVDKRVMLSIGVRNLAFLVDINFSITPIFQFNNMPIFSFHFPQNLNWDLLGCTGAFWYCNKEGIELEHPTLEELLMLIPGDAEQNKKALGFARTVLAELFDVMRGLGSTEDCLEALLRFFPYGDDYWIIGPGEAAAICSLLVYLKKFELCRECIDGYCRHWNSNPKCIESKAKFEPFIEVFTAALDSGDFTFLHDKFLEFSRNNVRHLTGTEFAFSEEDFAEFERSIEWMKGYGTQSGDSSVLT